MLLQQTPDGDIPYAMAGFGVREPITWLPSDTDLFLLWAATEYAFATRDFALLDAALPFYPAAGGPSDLDPRGGGKHWSDPPGPGEAGKVAALARAQEWLGALHPDVAAMASMGHQPVKRFRGSIFTHWS